VDIPDRPGGTGPDAVLSPLDPEQRAVALAARGPVCVLAGAGTGKTRAVAHRIAYTAAAGLANPARVLAVTFTTRAAGELRARLRQLGALAPGAGLEKVQALTFHAAALRQLTHFWPVAVGGPPPQVIDSKVTLIAEAARRLRLSAGLPELRDAASEIEWAKVTQVRPEDYPAAGAKAGRAGPYEPETMARLFAGYEQLRRERHLVDFESVLELTAAILVDHAGVASAVQDRYESFVVDEYQDVNPLQKLLLEAWLGGRDDICVVGDPRQTIYSFTGATPAYLTGFPAEFPAATVIRLVRNYRSSPQVVDLANRLIQRAELTGPGSGAALVAQRPAGPRPRFTDYPDENAEAAGVARQAAALIRDGVPAGAIAVLVRTNAQTQLLEQALAAAGVPFAVRGAERFFERAEVRQAVATLRGAARSVSAADDAAAQVRPVLAGIGLSARPPAGRGTARERWESLEALAQLADEFFAATPQASLGDLAAELALRSATGQAPALDGVTLASLHAAKGLEWDAVFLAGLTDGTLPIVYAQTDEAIAEERRLLYVGITRARQQLFLSWALARAPGGRRTRRPSRFLAGLQSRARPPEEDDPLVGALRRWRAETAAAQSVPAYVVLSDATLLLIASRRPASRAELATVPGVGAVRLDRYGAAVLALCAQAAEAARAAGNAAEAP